MVGDKGVLGVFTCAQVFAVQAHARVTRYLGAVHTGVRRTRLVTEPAPRPPQACSVAIGYHGRRHGNRLAGKQLSGHEGFLHHLGVRGSEGVRVYVGVWGVGVGVD